MTYFRANQWDNEDGTRTCNKCSEPKSIDLFPKDKQAKRGHKSTCKVCWSAKATAWYAANQERQLERHRAQVARDRQAVREQDSARYYRHRDKRMQLATDVAHVRRVRLASRPADVGITVPRLRKRDGDTCCYCATTMTFERVPRGQYVAERATLEHVVPVSKSGSHTWDNTALACRQCNAAKRDTLLIEWLNRCPELLESALSQAVQHSCVALTTALNTHAPAGNTGAADGITGACALSGLPA